MKNFVKYFILLYFFYRACGHEVPYKIVGRRAGDLDSVVATCKLAEEELHWIAKKNLDDMCTFQ